MSHRPLLEADQLVKSFGGLVAVDKVSLAVEPASITAVLGPNGAGKTTLFNILSGVLKPTSGRLRFHGRDITADPLHEIAAMGMARTFQNLEMFEETSVLNTVLVGRHRHGTNGMIASALRFKSARRQERENREATISVLERFALTEVADRAAEDLPYGLQRRTELARAVASEPDLLLLDEPMAGLTGPESRVVADQMRELAEGGMAVLVVEHHVEAVLSVADHAIVLDQGRVISRGRPDDVRTDPAVVQAYLGVPDA